MNISTRTAYPGAWLTPGWHIIDGTRVNIGGAPASDGTILYPLALGRHFIDGHVAIVSNPAHVIQVPIGRRR
jgi:hypothetical protein